jgi:hypothetical protein
MKTIAIIMFLAFSVSTFAWEKIFSCNNDAFVIDRECSWQGDFPRKYNCNYQLVFNDRNVLDFLLKDTYSSSQTGIIAAKANDGYGRFETDSNLGYRLAVDPVRENSALEVKTQIYYHGTLITKKSWIFENCSLVNRY